jgi:CRP/FNR family transcriptional regulator
MGREIVRDHGVMLLLGSMRAEARLAAFLLNLTQRLQARGFSASSLVLRMTREEIGSYLGLKLETVSRSFSRFQEDGLLDVKQRDIRVLDADGLRRLLNEAPC